MKKIKVKFIFGNWEENVNLEFDNDDSEEEIEKIVDREWQSWVWDRIGDNGYWEIIDE